MVVGVSDLCRKVRYDELLNETEKSRLVEDIPVTDAIEGLHCRRYVPPTYRGRIRPQPLQNQPDSCKPKLEFGLCVDALFEDAWWEGVIFDHHDDAEERSVFFPDEGDVRRFNITNLRISRVWDEFLDVWRERGIWTLVELVRELEGDSSLPDYIKKIWNSLKRNYEFKKMISEWTCNVKTLWKKHFVVVLNKITRKSNRSSRKMSKVSPSVKNQIKCSAIRKRYSVSQSPQQTSDNVEGPAQEEKKTDSSTADNVLKIQKIKTSSQEVERGLHAVETADDVLLSEKTENPSSELGRGLDSVKTTDDILPSEEIETPSEELERGLFSAQTLDDVLPSKKIETSTQEVERGLYPAKTGHGILTSEKDKTSAHEGERESYSMKTDNSLFPKNCFEAQPLENYGQDMIKSMVSHNRKRKRKAPGRQPVDTICFACQCPDDLAVCHGCGSSYHLSCLDLKVQFPVYLNT